MPQIPLLHRGLQIADRCHNGFKNLIGNGLQRMDDSVIVVVKAGSSKADELGDQNVVSRIHHHSTDLVHTHGSHIAEDHLRIRFIHLLNVLFLQIGI